MAEIIVSGLNKTYGSTRALADVTFTLPQGRIYGFIGPNGSGKTTCLRIMSGLEFPDSGDVEYDGISIIEYPDKIRRLTGFMPDSLPYAPDMRVWEYLDFFARAFDLKDPEKSEILSRITAMCNLSSIENRFIAGLSKGMRQLVSLARVLIHDPEVLFLDEPAAGLDPRARTELLEILKDLAFRGKTIFISSHILSELDDIVDGAVIIEKGRIVSAGDIALLAAGSNENPDISKIIITFSVNAEQYIEAMKTLPNVVEAELFSARQIALAVSDSNDGFKNAMKELFSRDLPVIGMTRSDMGLESVFMNSTRGDIQ